MTKLAPQPLEAVERDGFALVSQVLSADEIDRLRTATDVSADRLNRGGSTFGGRNLLAVAEVRELAAKQTIRDLVEPLVGGRAMPVRALYFDKTATANWPVLWHQDLTIALAERHDLADWGPWSIKAGVPHVEAPASLLATMLTIRLHLDECDAANGPLRVLPGSHRQGRLNREQIQTLRAEKLEVACLAPLGSALLMRPMLLHASSPAIRPSHRRVVHVEFANRDALPAPLTWAHDNA